MPWYLPQRARRRPRATTATPAGSPSRPRRPRARPRAAAAPDRRIASRGPAPPAATRPARGGQRRTRTDGVPELRSHPRRRGAVLRGLRVRLHHRHMPRPPTPRPARTRGRGAGAATRRRWPRPSPSTGWPRSGSTRTGTRPRRARTPARHRGCRPSSSCGEERARRAPLDEPQHPPGDRLHRRPGREPAPGAADDGRPAVVGRGPPVLERHLRRAGERPAADRPLPPVSGASSPRTTGSTSGPGPGSSCAGPRPRKGAGDLGLRLRLRRWSRDRATPRPPSAPETSGLVVLARGRSRVDRRGPATRG